MAVVCMVRTVSTSSALHYCDHHHQISNLKDVGLKFSQKVCVYIYIYMLFFCPFGPQYVMVSFEHPCDKMNSFRGVTLDL